MLKNILTKGVKVALFAIIGNIAAAFLQGLADHQPTGLDTLSGLVWPAVAAGLAGLLAAIRRWAGWDPSRR